MQFSPKLHIGLVTWDFPPAKGGLGRAMQWIAEGLRERNMEVFVLQPHTKHSFLSFTKTFGGQHLFSFLLPFVLQKWIDTNKIDVLLFPVGPGGVWLLQKPKRCVLFGISYHTFAQQARCVPGEQWKRVVIPLERRTMHLCATISCYAEDTKHTLAKDYHVPTEKIVQLPCIFDTSFWNRPNVPARKLATVLCVSRLEKRKGVDVLLQAWKKVEEQHATAELILVGRGKLEVQMDSQTHTLSRVKRIPQVTREELVQLTQEATLSVLPSYLEGFGLAVTEAMAAGTPVMGSDVEGTRNLITPGKTGALVRAGNAEAWAEAILHALQETEERERMAAEAKEWVLTSFNTELAKDKLQEAVLSVYTATRA